MPSKEPPTPALNIPSGNSPVTPDPSPFKPEDRLTGDKWQDYKTAFERIRFVEDFENIGQIPCARKSFLYGIGGGVGVGVVRFLATHRVPTAGNWAVLSFIAIASFQREVCTRARRKELSQMRAIAERFPHRHVSKLQRKDDSTPDDRPS